MIILAATPIGNLGDASPRLVEALESATVIAAEDTRTTGQLIRLLGVTNRPELVSLHEHNERDRAVSLIDRAASEDVLVLSDAGMPTVSDPGYILVAAAVSAGVRVSAIPGPSAVITALAVSGLPSDRFTFEGFVPRKDSDRRSVLQALVTEPRTMVFFESAARITKTLTVMAEVFGEDRRAALCRELTKKFEEVKHDTVAGLAAWSAAGLKGEIVLVVEGASAQLTSRSEALQLVRAAVASGARLKDAARDVASLTGLSARELYQDALDAKSP